MAFVTSTIYTQVDQTTGGKGPNPVPVDLPDAAASITNYRALANMAGSGKIIIQIGGEVYAIPMLSNV